MTMWQASIWLELIPVEARTVLGRCCHHGPLRVQRVFHPEPVSTGTAPCHVYIVHPPGGVVGGDTLDTTIRVHAGGHALVTTPAATKFYRSAMRWATQRMQCQVDAGAVLELLPLETIFFENCWSRRETRVELEDGAGFVGWDIACLGRPAAGEGFLRGAVLQHLSLYRGGKLLWMDRSRFEGGSERLHAPWGLAGFPAWGTLVCVPPNPIDPTLVTALRAQLDDRPWSGITALPDVLLYWILGENAESIRSALVELWSRLRPRVFGRQACNPRIWAT
jgi:urease accessory protein